MDDPLEHLKTLFAQAIDLAEEEQRQFLASLDPHVAAELSSLLDSHRKADKFLSPLSSTASATEAHEWVGKSVGPYRLVREVGQGGMGEVYEAVRDDGTFRKQVAVKFVRFGASRTELLKRFHRERQTLAHLEHPNIARLLDGGTAPEGIPYLVMEFVDGKRIDEYCDEHKLSLRQRLELFRTVCSAVEYAHRNLVVHRDIKPGNILVTSDGAPKLVDFGIAKLLVEEVTEGEKTLTGGKLFTPEYASPEQLSGGTVTTVSDVYSLGVLLYKLLTGQFPHHFVSARSQGITRSTLEGEVTAPSTKTPVIQSPESPDRVRRMLAGDLDTIVLMALRNEPERRYASVEQFSADVERHLEGKTVVARPSTFAYRAGKFIRRNRVAAVATAIVLVTLVGGLVSTLYQVRVARSEKERAESINLFLQRMLSYSNPLLVRSKQDAGGPRISEVLEEASKRIESGEFDGQPDVKAQVEKIIGQCYNGQGRYDLATQHFERYIEVEKTLYSEEDPRVIEAKGVEAGLFFQRGEFKEAEKEYREVLPAMRKAYEAGLLKAEALARALNVFGYLRRTQGDSKEAEQVFREVLSLVPNVPEEEKYLLGVTRSTLASTLADQGRFEDALRTAFDAVREAQHAGFSGTSHYGFSLTVVGGFLIEKGRFTEANDTLQVAEKIFRRLLEPSSLWLGDNLRNQAISFYQQGRYREGLSKVKEALQIYLESFGRLYDQYPTALATQGLILTRLGEVKKGEDMVREALKIRTENLPEGHYMTGQAYGALGECLMIQKRYSEAQPVLIKSYEILRKSQGENNPRTLLEKRQIALLAQVTSDSNTKRRLPE